MKMKLNIQHRGIQGQMRLRNWILFLVYRIKCYNSVLHDLFCVSVYFFFLSYLYIFVHLAFLYMFTGVDQPYVYFV